MKKLQADYLDMTEEKFRSYGFKDGSAMGLCKRGSDPQRKAEVCVLNISQLE